MPQSEEKRAKHAAYMREWYAKNKEKVKAWSARYARRKKEKNPDAFRAEKTAQVKSWRERHKDDPKTPEERERLRKLSRIRNARYRDKDRERYRAQARDKARRYYAANPEKYKAVQHSKRAVKAAGKVTTADWMATRAAYDGRCAYCDNVFAKLEMDHVLALTKGGKHVPGNVVPACRGCNAGKGNRTRSPRPPRYPELMPAGQS